MHPSSPPLIGFNNNVEYRGLRLHIQTEDSGCERPHVITHLFADGGYVVKSVRTDYSDYVGHPERTKLVRRMMKKQHLDVAIELRNGNLDSRLEHLIESARESSASGVAWPDENRSKRSTSQPPVTEREKPRHAVMFPVSPQESLDDVILSHLASFHDEGAES